MRKLFRKITAILLIIMTIVVMISVGLIGVGARTTFEQLRETYKDNAVWDSTYQSGRAVTCHGFAMQLGHELTDISPYNWTSYSGNDLANYLSSGNLKVGDIIRLYYTQTDEHTIMVTEISGASLKYVDCNWPGGNVIHWDRTATISGTTINLFNSNYPIHYVLSCPITISTHNPTGELDSVESSSPNSITVSGWAFDKDNYGAILQINVYIDGELAAMIRADKSRPDVNVAYGGIGENHGFYETIQTSKSGNVNVSVYAINIGEGENVAIGSSNVNIQANNPEGAVDRILSNSGESIYIKGWAYDKDDVNANLQINVYVDGELLACIKADKYRPDVNQVYPGAGEYHGFEETLSISKIGEVNVSIYAINIGAGEHVGIGSSTVNIKPKKAIINWSIPSGEITGVNKFWFKAVNCEKSDYIDSQVELYIDNSFIHTMYSDDNGYYAYNVNCYVYNNGWHSVNAYFKNSSGLEMSTETAYFKVMNGKLLLWHVPEGKVTGKQKVSFKADNCDYANSKVELLIDNESIATLIPDTDGFYSFNIDCNKLSNGKHTIKGNYTNNNGSFFSSPLGEFTVYNGTFKIWHIPEGSLSGKNQFWFKVEDCEFENSEAKIYIDGKEFKSYAKPDDSGFYSLMLNCNHLSNGTHSIMGEFNNADGVSLKTVVGTFQVEHANFGDTNLDGTISIGDVTAIQRHLAELELFTSEQIALADVNGDGEVDITDATHLQMYLAEYDIVLG